MLVASESMLYTFKKKKEAVSRMHTHGLYMSALKFILSNQMILCLVRRFRHIFP